ncbi:hypothetical protein [Arthrobacter sp. L77]|uniref:hypothetical protein n=1 Tax=Arthrobacter sp. L77 TaxID=1496689 RepID=UPI000A62A4C8|nr:hypothetical protein [Arthrobacter sp. L77]
MARTARTTMTSFTSTTSASETVTAGIAPANTCGGILSTVLATRSIIGPNLVLNTLASMTSAKADNLRITAALPTAADNAFQGRSRTVDFSFTATQRAATNR